MMLTVLRHSTASSFTSAIRCATGRSAILHLIKQYAPQTVFMPSYVPEGVINPFIASNVKIVFYKLLDDLWPDIGDLAEKLSLYSSERPLVVGIQYFGFHMPFSDMAHAAHTHGGILLADCAHSLITSGNAASADIVLHSLNKFLAVPDGAIMASRRREIDLSANDLPPLPPSVIECYRAHLQANAKIALAAGVVDAAEPLAASNRAYADYYKQINRDMRLMAQSAESRAVEAATDFQYMAQSRWAKSLWLRQNLNEPLIVRNEAAQFAFPIRCYGQREDVRMALMEIGVMASTLDDRWDHVPKEGFIAESEFLHDHLLLPIGEEVGFEMLLAMANELNRFA